MYIKTIQGIEGVEAHMHIQHTEAEGIKYLKYVTPGAEIAGYISDTVALILKESDTIMQPSGITNITEYVIGLYARKEIKNEIESILRKPDEVNHVLDLTAAEIEHFSEDDFNEVSSKSGMDMIISRGTAARVKNKKILDAS